MREERGKIAGNLTVNEPTELWGSVAGKVTVSAGAKMYVRGQIYGDLHVQSGGRVHIFGNVMGDLRIDADAKVIVNGMVGGKVQNAGRLTLETGAKVGKVKTTGHGETLQEKY